MIHFRISLLAAVLLLFASSLSAQPEVRSSHGALYMISGLHFFNFKSLDGQLSENGLPTTPAGFGTGFGGYGVHGRWIFGGEGMYFQGNNGSPTADTWNRGGLGYFYTSYQIVDRQKFRLHPSIGLGLGGINEVISKNANSTPVDDVIAGQPNARAFGTGSFLLHQSLAADYILGKHFFVGLKGCYNLALSRKSSWVAPGSTSDFKDPFSSLSLLMTVGFRLE